MEPTQTRETLPTIWQVSDAMWEHFFLPLMSQLDPPSRMGRARADQRKCLDGMIYRARTGCQWNRLPKEFGSDSTVHRTVRRWEDKGVLDQLWALLIYHCEELGQVHWEWQAADGCLHKARFIGKKGAKATRQNNQNNQKRSQKASAPTPPTAQKWASRTACLSREQAARLLPVSPEPT